MVADKPTRSVRTVTHAKRKRHTQKKKHLNVKLTFSQTLNTNTQPPTRTNMLHNSSKSQKSHRPSVGWVGQGLFPIRIVSANNRIASERLSYI